MIPISCVLIVCLSALLGWGMYLFTLPRFSRADGEALKVEVKLIRSKIDAAQANAAFTRR